MAKKHAFNGRPESSALAHSRAFARRVHHIMDREFFVKEFIKALGEHNIGITFDGTEMKFVKYVPTTLPSYEELMQEVIELRKQRETEQ